MKQRLQKILAQRGIASRREAERLLLAGRVTVNGKVVTTLGSRADADADDIRVDGRLLPAPQPPRLLMVHKPAGYLCTSRPSREIGRSILELVPADRRYFTVGRLDRDSSGLILLTDNGDLANRLTHPRHKVHKVYEVECESAVPRERLHRLTEGVLLDDGPARALRVSRAAARTYRVVLGEGRKRQVRRMFAAVGAHVVRLHRTQIGGLRLHGLPPGCWREVSASEIEEFLSTAPATARRKTR